MADTEQHLGYPRLKPYRPITEERLARQFNRSLKEIFVAKQSHGPNTHERDE